MEMGTDPAWPPLFFWSRPMNSCGQSADRKCHKQAVYLDAPTAPNPILQDGVKNAAQYQP
jgi:hypothetical protein